LPLSRDALVELSSSVVLTLALTTFLFATNMWGYERIGRVFVAVAAFSLVIEAVGTRTGVPFGRYEYADLLQPQVADVPVIVPLAWFAMALPAWEVARRITSSVFGQCFLGGYALAVWDLFLDPQMTHNGFWVFDPSAWSWQGVPLTNWVGWWLVGSAVTWLVARQLSDSRRNDGLAFLYAWMVGFSALGFLLPIAFDRPAVGLVGLVAAAPLLCAAFLLRTRTWPTSAS
jgi:uncharacterized membrane protein